jgi:hypothetical protein
VEEMGWVVEMGKEEVEDTAAGRGWGVAQERGEAMERVEETGWAGATATVVGKVKGVWGRVVVLVRVEAGEEDTGEVTGVAVEMVGWGAVSNLHSAQCWSMTPWMWQACTARTCACCCPGPAHC